MYADGVLFCLETRWTRTMSSSLSPSDGATLTEQCGSTTMCLCFVRRSDRYRCLNNIPDYKSALFKDLNDEQKARELPGRFSDLNDQCRRAFGVNFEYCKDLSHGVKTSIARWTHSILVHFSRSALVSTVERSTRISRRVSPITHIGRTARYARSREQKSK